MSRTLLPLPKVLEAFFQVLPQAILAAVEVCMEQTDPQELSSLVSDGDHQQLLISLRKDSKSLKNLKSFKNVYISKKFENI